MSFKNLVCPILSPETDAPVLAAAEAVAETSDAQLIALLIELEPEPVYTIEGVLEAGVRSDRTRKACDDNRRKLEARGGPRPFPVESLAVSAGQAGLAVGARTQLGDLTIMLRPGDAPCEDLRTAIFEGALFGSGRPVLLIPPDWRQGAIGHNVVVGWNGKREAARALADAGPFLDHAKHITVLCIALGAGNAKVEASAEALVTRLAHAGRHVELRRAGEFGFSDGVTLLQQAGGLDADLVVIGGYGSPRLREFIFGGVTREVMKTARMPVLLSH